MPEHIIASSNMSAVHRDVIEAHILTRLDGQTLASTACTSSEFRMLASQDTLWANICRSTWPSTSHPLVRQLVSGFPDGPRSFFSDVYPLITDVGVPSGVPSSTSVLISAVDISYRGNLVFSNVVETETVSGWFWCSPFRIDLLDPKDVVATQIPKPETEDTCRFLEEELTLSWIVIDPAGGRAVDLSSRRPVSVHQHWLSGDVQARFVSVVPGGEKGSAVEQVELVMVVTCGGGAAMQLREVSLQVVDMEGTHLNGKESLAILKRAMQGKRGRGGRRVDEGRRRYAEFLEKKRERREMKMRTEGALDTMCVAFGVLLAFASVALLFLWK